MTRKERLEFCKICTKREFDTRQGLLCGITGAKANFQDVCVDYEHDQEAEEQLASQEIQSLEGELAYNYPKEVIDKLKEEQNFNAGILTGIIVGILGGVLWAIISVSSGLKIGLMAVLIGAAIGFVIRITGKGVEQKFGFWAAGIALLSLLIGDFLTIIGFIANSIDIDFLDTLLGLDYSLLPEIINESFSPMNIVFYGIAIYEAYKFSFREITKTDVQKLSSTDN